MNPIKVLIVDDSILAREMLSDILNKDPGIQVMATASDGETALERVNEAPPDIVTMDLDMPGMGGMEALKKLKYDHPKIPVIMVSSATKAGAQETLNALMHGAQDYVTKPSGSLTALDAQEHLSAQLLQKIHTFSKSSLEISEALPKQTLRAPTRSAVALPRTQSRPIRVVGIASSTGGPKALLDIIPALPADFPVPVLIVQHMPAMFTRTMAERLDASSALTVIEAVEGTEICKGNVYVAPGDHHLKIVRAGSRAHLALGVSQADRDYCPSADILFSSMCESFGAGALAVILTGMGKDGLNGCRELFEAGAPILAQDRESSVIWGMPGSVVKEGLASCVSDQMHMADEIQRFIRRGQKT